jgi:hypothetical protein
VPWLAAIATRRSIHALLAARISGQSVGAIKVNTHRAIRALRALLGQD